MSWRTSLLTVRDVLKDIVLTALGVACIWSQIFRQHPDGLLLGTGLALTVPTIASHVRALLPGPGAGDSSPPMPPPQQPPLSPSSSGRSDGR